MASAGENLQPLLEENLQPPLEEDLQPPLRTSAGLYPEVSLSPHILCTDLLEINVARQQGDYFGALGSVRGPVSQSNDTGSRSGFDPVITRLTANLIGKKPPR